MKGQKFVLRTDHQPLIYLTTLPDPHHKYARWISRLQAYNFDIEYIKGEDIVVADYLSRDFGAMGLMKHELAAEDHVTAQNQDPGISAILLNNRMASDSPYVKVARSLNIMEDGLLRKSNAIVESEHLRAELLKEDWHEGNVGHIGVGKMRRKLGKRYIWPTMFRDID
jgi:hypothetical protein